VTTQPKWKPRELDFEQIEMLANFSDNAADYPALKFEKIAKKLGVDFSNEASEALSEGTILLADG